MKKDRWKKRGLITLCVVAGLVLLSLPTIFFPESEVLYYIAYGPLTILWAAFYLFLFLLLILFVLFFINGAHGGYTDGGWKAMGLSVVICLAVICGLGFLLTRADFVPFSDESFRVPFFSELFPNKKTVDGYTFTIQRVKKKNTATLIEYEGDAEILVIPSVVDGAAVTRIGDRVFLHHDEVKAYVLPETIESFGVYAFPPLSPALIFTPKPRRDYDWDDKNEISAGTWCVMDEPAGRETVLFGRYEQDGDASDGAEPVEWLVLAEEGNRQLLLSRYSLERHRYDRDTGTAWEDSELKQWMNTTFADAAFTAEERARIGTEGVFLPTEEQTETYLTDPEARNTRPSLDVMIRSGTLTGYRSNEGKTAWLVRNENGQPRELMMNGKYSGLTNRGGMFLIRPAVWVTKTDGN